MKLNFSPTSKKVCFFWSSGGQEADGGRRLRPSGEQHAGGATHLQPGEATLHHWKRHLTPHPQVCDLHFTKGNVGNIMATPVKYWTIDLFKHKRWIKKKRGKGLILFLNRHFLRPISNRCKDRSHVLSLIILAECNLWKIKKETKTWCFKATIEVSHSRKPSFTLVFL